MCVCLQVLFPLLTKLLDNISPADVGGMEETRMRGCTLLSKVQANNQQTQHFSTSCLVNLELRDSLYHAVFHVAERLGC